LAVGLVGAPAVVSAASGLSGIMHGWKREAGTLHAMLVGRATFDAAEATRILNLYVQESASLRGRIRGGDAASRDIAHRFAAFEEDARAALRHVAQRSALATDVSRLLSNCQSCHDVYN
jgi:cytochrome c556